MIVIRRGLLEAHAPVNKRVGRHLRFRSQELLPGDLSLLNHLRFNTDTSATVVQPWSR